MTTGERMRQRRKELGYSAEKVADLLGVSPATIYRYENGGIEKMPGSILEPISRILNVTPSYLMGWDGACAEPAESSVKLSSEELQVLEVYRGLSAEGRAYIAQQLDIAAALYGEKNNPVPADCSEAG